MVKRKVTSLNEHALNVVVDNFTSYSSSYLTANNNDYARRCLHFLRKVHTLDIIIKLIESNRLKKEHLDFLLNEYLQKLNIGFVLNLLSNKETIEKVSMISHSITELFHGYYCGMNCIDAFKALVPCSPNLTKICVPDICDDGLLKVIADSLCRLSELDITNSRSITEVGVSALCASRSKHTLKILRINETSLDAEDIKLLIENLPELQEVNHSQFVNVLHYIYKGDMHNNTLENIPKYKFLYLEFLEIFEPPNWVSTLSICSKLCPSVKQINILADSDEELRLCCQFLELENFHIEGLFGMPWVDINPFLTARGKKLKDLSVANCTLSMSTLIAFCSTLEMLELTGVVYQKLKDGVSKNLPKLKTLRLYETDCNDDFCSESIILLLNSCPELESLQFHDCNFTDSKILTRLSRFFSNCASIKKLSITFSESVDVLKQIVLRCHGVESLWTDVELFRSI